MEYRESPRISTPDLRDDNDSLDETESPSGFRRLQVDFPKLVAAILLGIAGLVIILYLANQAVRVAVRWLHSQPQYQMKFEEIRLRTEPPPWFQGGTRAFLRQVRESSNEGEALSLMDVDLARLKLDFKLSPWVAEVTRIEHQPEAILVDLVYRQPVASIPYPGGKRVYLDREGCMLPTEDIIQEKARPLIQISRQGLTPSDENQPGKVWRVDPTTTDSAARLDARVLGAARLAGFLRDQASDPDLPASLQIVAMNATNPRGIFLQTAETVMILWGEPPDGTPAGWEIVRDRWRALEKWAKNPESKKLPSGDYWEISGNELRHIETRK
jgi:hypothetical protein